MQYLSHKHRRNSGVQIHKHAHKLTSLHHEAHNGNTGLNYTSSYNPNNIKEIFLKLHVETWFEEFPVSRWSGKFCQVFSTVYNEYM